MGVMKIFERNWWEGKQRKLANFQKMAVRGQNAALHTAYFSVAQLGSRDIARLPNCKGLSKCRIHSFCVV
jgi:hypothetical protein